MDDFLEKLKPKATEGGEILMRKEFGVITLQIIGKSIKIITLGVFARGRVIGLHFRLLSVVGIKNTTSQDIARGQLGHNVITGECYQGRQTLQIVLL